MGGSFYGRLFRYCEGEDRAPLENFLTEALAEVLNRQHRHERQECAADLFLPRDAAVAWNDFVRDHKTMEWRTQHQAGSRIPDLVLIGDDGPLVVVEIKVAAPIGMHRIRPSTDSREAQAAPPRPHLHPPGQLHAYGR